jgi:hypothetical protein
VLPASGSGGRIRDRARCTLTGPELKDLVTRLKNDEGVLQKALAAEVGISEAGLSRFLSGHQVPSTDRPRPTASTGAANPESLPKRL